MNSRSTWATKWEREKHSTGQDNMNEWFYQLLYFVPFRIYQALLQGLREKHTVGPGLHSMGEAAVNLCTHTLAPNLPEDDTVIEMLWEAHALVLQTSRVLDSASLEWAHLLISASLSLPCLSAHNCESGASAHIPMACWAVQCPPDNWMTLETWLSLGICHVNLTFYAWR